MIYLLHTIQRYWLLLTLINLLVITTLSLWPVATVPEVPGSDKTHHFIAYAALALPTALRRPRGWWGLLALFVVWSGAIELLQPYVNRYGEWLDLAANVGGVGCGALVGWLILRLARFGLSRHAT